MALTSGLPSSGGSKSALIARLRTAIAKEKNATKKARLTEQLSRLTKPTPVGKPKSGDPMAKYASIRSYTPKRDTDKSAFGKFVGNLADYSYKEPKEIDWEKEREKRSHQTVEEMYGLGSSASDPGGFMPYSYGWKHGGRIKKAKKKSKKRRPKGVRIALRGYGKAMGRG
jgi:hypothetical protein